MKGGSGLKVEGCDHRIGTNTMRSEKTQKSNFIWE